MSRRGNRGHSNNRSYAQQRMAYESRWHLDKRVPIVIVLALGAQLFGVVWFFSQQDAELKELRKDVNTIQHLQREQASKFERLVRVETQLDSIQKSLEELTRQVVKLFDRTRDHMIEHARGNDGK